MDMTTTSEAPATLTPDTSEADAKAAAHEADLAARRKAVEAALDDFGRMAVERLIAQTNARNVDVGRLNSVGGDRITRLDSMRSELAAGEGTYDASLVALVKQISTLEDKVADLKEQRDKALNAVIDAEVASSDVDPAALEEAIKAADANIRSGLNYATGIYGEDVKLLLPESTPRKGSRKGSSASGGGSGKRRLRGFDVYVNGVKATTPDKDQVQRSSFSAAAKVVGLDSVDPLSAAYRERNGEDPDKFPAEDTFPFTHEGATFEVRAVRV